MRNNILYPAFLILILGFCIKYFSTNPASGKAKSNSIQIINYNQKYNYYLEWNTEFKSGEVFMRIVNKADLPNTESAEKLISLLAAFEKLPSQYEFIKDGIFVPAEEVPNLKKLAAEDLSAVHTLNIKAATKIYGKAAKPFTVLINTK